MIKKLLAACACAGLLMTTTSCLKKQNLDDENLGDPIAPMELTKAMGAGYGSFDYNEIKKNEFTSLLYTYSFQAGVTQSVWEEDMTVKEVSNTVDALSLDVIVQKMTFSNNQQASLSTREWPFVFNKSSAKTNAIKTTASTLDNEDQPTFMFITFMNYALNLCYDSGDYPQTCHNLTSTDIQYPVPPAAAAQQNCNDVTNCFVAAKKIEFDLLEKANLDKNGKPRRTHLTIVLSPKVPFLSRMLQLCTRSLYDFTGANQQILGDVCYTVNNFATAP